MTNFGPELKHSVTYIGEFLLLQCQIGLYFSCCFQYIGLKTTNLSNGQLITHLEVCFVKTMSGNFQLQENE